MVTPNPILYILARNDLNSMNPGKLAAQCCHAANMAGDTIMFGRIDGKRSDRIKELWDLWAGGRGFGTTIVLETPISVLKKMADEIGDHLFNWEDKRPIIYGVVEDPSYPVSDGSIVHHVPLITCGYIFGDKNKFDVTSITGPLKLYP